MKFVLTILMVCCFCDMAFAQNIRFDQISVSDGLSSSSVYKIYQDSRGILWLGTLDGLNRYDGYSINVFKHDRLDPHSLSNNRITEIYEDSDRNLWLYDEYSSTINRYTPQNNRFKAYYLDNVAGHDLERPDTIYANNEGLYLKSRLGYQVQYRAANDSFYSLPPADPTPVTPAYDEETAQLVQLFGDHLAATGSPYTMESVQIQDVLRDSGGRFWIATKFDGLYTAVKENGGYSFTSHFHTGDKFRHVNSEDIYDVFEDRSQVVWIGTKNSGLYRFTPYKYKFDFIEQVELETGPFRLGTIRAITQDNSGTLWAGTNDQGLLRIDLRTLQATLYGAEAGNPASVGHRFIRALSTDEDGTLWVGHYDGFSIYHPATDDFTQHMFSYPAPQTARVYDFKRGRDKTVWMAAWDFIYEYNPVAGRVNTITRAEKGAGFINENIRELLLDNNGYLWLAVGEKGMILYNKKSDRFTTYRSDPHTHNSLPSSNILHVHKDRKNQLWLATADGLCLFDTLHNTFTTYTVNDGLPGNLVYGILEDHRGNLWLSTTQGVSRFDPEQKLFRNYDASDGLQSNEFTENAFYQNSTGEIFLGGVNGLNTFHPDRVPDNPTPPVVIITGLKVFDKPLSEVILFNEETLYGKISRQEEITLRPEQRSITVEFAGLHYVNPAKNRYAYMLEGFDNDWIYTDASVRFANYTNLEPGSYCFKVKACNSDGRWTDDAVQLNFVIAPPFYTRPWFLTLGGLLIVTLTVAAYRTRIATIKKQQSLKATQLESELNFLKSQVNPHFLFNTLNNIYALCQENSRNAAPMVGKVSEMMRYMLYDCNADRVLLQKEIAYLKNYIDLVRLKNFRKLNVDLRINGSPNGLKIAPLLLINFLENSFKHGDVHLNDQGFVRIRIGLQGPEMTFSLVNSFTRRDTAGAVPQKGIGLKNVKQRLNLLYKGRYHLKIAENNRIFEVELKLILD